MDINEINIFKIAVTGGAASGKSSVCQRFHEKGLDVIYLDMLAREVVMPGLPAYEKIISEFGPDVVNGDEGLNRAYLRRLMTDEPQSKKKIEAIVQPEIMRRMYDLIAKHAKNGERFVVVEVPLLFELKMEKKFDCSVLITIDPETQIRRLMDRDSVSDEEARGLVKIQMAQEEKLEYADIIIENIGGIEEFLDRADDVIKKIMEKTNNIPKALDS